MNAAVDISDILLETERLLIRPWKEADLQDFYEYARVDGVGQMAGWNPHKSIEESKEVLQMFMEQKQTFALEFKENARVIGSVGLEQLTIEPGEAYANLVGREIGYVLSKDYWGQGLMPEAVKCVIDYCFMQEKYDFLLCSHSLANIQSKRVIEKCGFTFLREQERTALNGEEHVSKYYVRRNR